MLASSLAMPPASAPHALTSCKVIKCSVSPFLQKNLQSVHTRGKSYSLINGRQLQKHTGVFFVAAMATVVPSENTFELLEEDKNMGIDVKCNSSKEIDPKEATRRMNISKANKGKVPWNKGRKHSPETIARIKERTKQVMKTPKVRLKLSLAQFFQAASQSEERKEQIRAILRSAWEVRRKRLMLQQTCIIEWKESIADSARRGGDGEDELNWNSYKTLTEDFHRERLQAVAPNKTIEKEHGNRRAAKSAKQRQKIAEAIKTKWTDPEYRQKVLIGKRKALQPKNLMAHKKRFRMKDMNRDPSSLRNKLPPSYSDPQAGAKLQMIKQIRAIRAAVELEERATERTMSLIAEAEKAAKALEAGGIDEPLMQAFLSKTRRLIDKAIHSMQAAESGKSASAPMLENVFSRAVYTDAYFMDRSLVADPAVPHSGDNYGVDQSSFTKNRKICENTSPACPRETPLNNEISRNTHHSSHEHGDPISFPKIGSPAVPVSIKSSIGSVHEGISDKVSGQDNMFSVEINSAGANATLADEQENTDLKGESRSAENMKRDIISSIVHSKDILPSIAGKSEVKPSRTVKYEEKKKWVRGRLIEVKED